MRIYAQLRLLQAKKVSELSESQLRKIANNSKDKRHAQAKQELLKRRSLDVAKSTGKGLLNVGKGVGKGLATVGVGLADWATAPSTRVPSLKKFDGTKAERQLKQMQYKEAQNRAREVHRKKYDALYDKIWS